jgi:hypothetical protein
MVSFTTFPLHLQGKNRSGRGKVGPRAKKDYAGIKPQSFSLNTMLSMFPEEGL